MLFFVPNLQKALSQRCIFFTNLLFKRKKKRPKIEHCVCCWLFRWSFCLIIFLPCTVHPFASFGPQTFGVVLVTLAHSTAITLWVFPPPVPEFSPKVQAYSFMIQEIAPTFWRGKVCPMVCRECRDKLNSSKTLSIHPNNLTKVQWT